MTGRLIQKAIHGAALALAIAGGLALIAMTLLTVISITGRGLIWLGLGPIPGSYELVEMGAAFAVFCFLPWCQLKRGHVTVDLFLRPLGPRINRGAELISNLLITGAAGVIAWRLWLGLVDKGSTSETSYILGIPAWFGYAAACLGAMLFVLASAYTVWRSFHELRGGASQAPHDAVDEPEAGL